MEGWAQLNAKDKEALYYKAIEGLNSVVLCPQLGKIEWVPGRLRLMEETISISTTA